MKLFIIALLFCSNVFAAGWETRTLTDPMTGAQEIAMIATSEQLSIGTTGAMAGLKVFKDEVQFYVVGASVACIRNCNIRMSFNGTNVQNFTADVTPGTNYQIFTIREDARFRRSMSGIFKIALEVPLRSHMATIFTFDTPFYLQPF